MTKRLSGANLWAVGGGELVGQFDDAGLLDEIILGMSPVTLGGGAPLTLLPPAIDGSPAGPDHCPGERQAAGGWRSPWKTASTLFPSGSMTNAA